MNSDLEKNNDVGDRARIILSEIVESYLNKGTPVSSKVISRKINSILSPSTVRLIMSNLEEKGLLYSPHTSSGRVPTDKGLKFFVDGIARNRRFDFRRKRKYSGKMFCGRKNFDGGFRSFF